MIITAILNVCQQLRLDVTFLILWWGSFGDLSCMTQQYFLIISGQKLSYTKHMSHWLHIIVTVSELLLKCMLSEGNHHSIIKKASKNVQNINKSQNVAQKFN